MKTVCCCPVRGHSHCAEQKTGHLTAADAAKQLDWMTPVVCSDTAAAVDAGHLAAQALTVKHHPSNRQLNHSTVLHYRMRNYKKDTVVIG